MGLPDNNKKLSEVDTITSTKPTINININIAVICADQKLTKRREVRPYGD